jgi:hypothetical protein
MRDVIFRRFKACIGREHMKTGVCSLLSLQRDFGLLMSVGSRSRYFYNHNEGNTLIPQFGNIGLPIF